MEPIPNDRTGDVRAPHRLGELCHWYHLDYEGFLRILKHLGCEQVGGSQIIAFSYTNYSSAHSYEIQRGPMDFDELTHIPHLLERIGDIGMNEEFPNNFKIVLAAQIRDDQRLLVRYECDEQPEICESCAPDHLNEAYSCEHGEDYVSASFSVAYGPIPDDSIEDLLYFY